MIVVRDMIDTRDNGVGRKRVAVMARCVGVAPRACAILVVGALVLLGCPEGTSGTGTGTGTGPDAAPTYPYVCENGDPASGTSSAQNEVRCARCVAGFGLDKDSACTTDIDTDKDGLIEISSLMELHNMRYNLAGTSYKTSADDAGATGGAPTAPTANCPRHTDGVYLCGYELTQDLDFDADDDRATFSGDPANIILDSGDNKDIYFETEAGGWEPIGTFANKFTAIFDGNGFTIANLAIRRDESRIGLFGVITVGAHIRNVGVVDVSLLSTYIGPSGGDYRVGLGGDAGGLVALQYGGRITASYASGTVHGGAGARDYVGGLVGVQNGGTITASYADVDVYGGNGRFDTVGGLVGRQVHGGSIIASYASGSIYGGDDSGEDSLGGLVGSQSGGSIIITSYATVSANAGDGIDSFGDLVPGRPTVNVTASYGFGTIKNVTFRTDSRKPAGVTAAAGLTADTAGSCSAAGRSTRSACEGAFAKWSDWNGQAGGMNAWIFGNAAAGNAVAPKLRYADYDGAAGTVFDCAMFPAGVTCGVTELPGQ